MSTRLPATITTGLACVAAQYDPKEAAKKRAAEAKAVDKAARLDKQAAGMRKMSSFFHKKA